MPKQLSESAAWRKLAEMHGANPSRKFICNQLGGILGLPWKDVSKMPHEVMLRRIKHHHKQAEYFCEDLAPSPYTGRNGSSATTLASVKRNDARVIFCLLMALEAEEEARPTKKSGRDG